LWRGFCFADQRSTPFGSFQRMNLRGASYSRNSSPRRGSSPSGLARFIRAGFYSTKRGGFRLAISRARALRSVIVWSGKKGEAPRNGGLGASPGPFGRPVTGKGTRHNPSTSPVENRRQYRPIATNWLRVAVVAWLERIGGKGAATQSA